jgi:hypothetical protein
METVAARMEPFPGSERRLASFLLGMGFEVFRVDGTFTVQASPGLWRGVFNEVDPLSREVVVPPDLADMVTRIVLLRSLSDPNGG